VLAFDKDTGALVWSKVSCGFEKRVMPLRKEREVKIWES